MVCKHCWFPGHQGLSRDGHISTSPKTLREGRIQRMSSKPSQNTLKVSTSQWNYIDEMYSDIRQGDQETTDQLDQCIKILVEKCGYQTNKEKERRRLELLFHATKHFEVKKWVRSQTALKETSNFRKTLAARKTTRGNHQRLPLTQVQWRSRNVYHHQ